MSAAGHDARGRRAPATPVGADAPAAPVREAQPCSPLASRAATRDVLRAFGVDPKKSFGQNFLVDDGVVRRIVELAGIDGQAVLEVGPGIGTLTLALLDHAAGVVAIERDEGLVRVLSSTVGANPRLRLIVADALKVTSMQVEQAAEALPGCGGGPTALVSNLPYAVAATVLLASLERLPSLASATVMVQKEVADRVMARPGAKDYGAYTVLVRLLARPAGRFEVGRESFVPAPHVDSSVIRLERQAPCMADGAPASSEVCAAAGVAAKAAFAQRRKTIRNSMRSYLASQGAQLEGLDAALAAAGVDPRTRGETLSPTNYLTLGEALLANGVLSPGTPGAR